MPPSSLDHSDVRPGNADDLPNIALAQSKAVPR